MKPLRAFSRLFHQSTDQSLDQPVDRHVQIANGQHVIQAARDVGDVNISTVLASVDTVREPIDLATWGLLKRQYEADDEACTYVPEDRAAASPGRLLKKSVLR